MPHRMLCMLVAASACTAQADSQTKPIRADAPKVATRARERAKALLEKQLKSLPSNNTAFLETLAKDAGVFVPGFPVRLDDPALDIGGQIASMNPHAVMNSAKLVQLVAGGTTAMTWLAADLEIVVTSSEPGERPVRETHAIRAVELLDLDSDKVVAASFTEVRPLEQLRSTRGPVPAETAAGPLVQLLASPDDLGESLAPDPVIVVGTEAVERAVGHNAAKVLLGKWRKVPLAIEHAAKLREVHTDKWGYAMAIVNIPQREGPPLRMSGLLIAVPSPNGAWSTVAVSYGAL